MKNTNFTFTGEFSGPAEFGLSDSLGHDNHLEINFPDTNEAIAGSFRTLAQGPFTLRIDSSSLLGDLWRPFEIVLDGENTWSLESDGWSSFEHVFDDNQNHSVEWRFDIFPTGVSSSVSLDRLVIDKTPFIVTESPDETIVTASPLFFSADVTGGSETQLQWYKNGAPLEGEIFDYLIVLGSGHSLSGEYQLIAENSFGVASSEPIQLVIQDDFGSVFPYQGWNWTVDLRSYLKLEEAGGLNADPAISFQVPASLETHPGLNFSFLGPRTVEILSSIPGGVANRFSIEVLNETIYTDASSWTGWGKTQIDYNYFGFQEATVRFIPGSSGLINPVRDDAPGLINRIKLSWPEDHPFTTWIKWALPHKFDTISDFELLFGDEDGDGIQNIVEYATLSSAVSKSSNVWPSLDENGRQENVTFYKPQVADDPFEYNLEVSSNLVEWERVPSVLEYIQEDPENARILARVSPHPDFPVQGEIRFLRLVISSRIHVPKNIQF